MTILDEPNIIYEVDKAREELLEQMGPKHTFSLEAPYGIRDAHSRDVILARYNLVRNWVHPMDAEYMDGYMRGNNTDPGHFDEAVPRVGARPRRQHRHVRADEAVGRHLGPDIHVARARDSRHRGTRLRAHSQGARDELVRLLQGQFGRG